MKKFKYVIFICIISAIFYTGCQDVKSVDVSNYEPSCQVFLKCMYLNQKNPDKSVCMSLADGCKSANDFAACQKNTKMDFRDCLLLMRK